jgi:hypothetical protein
MLDSLDTLIAFILIMLVVSLLITIAVQMVSSALNLRGLNLAQGLKRTFAVIVPTSIDPLSEENAKKLANFILKSRFLSDSFLPNWGVFKLWRHAQAIRPGEVFDAIHRIAIGKEPVEDATLRENARKLLISLGFDEKTIDDAANKIGAVQQGTKQLTDVVSTLLPEADQTKVQSALKNVTDQLAVAGQAVATQIVGAAATLDAARKKFEDWTCICQERAQQWLTMHTRILTIIFAVVAAFCLQLDTVELFKLVSNKAVRDKLVAQVAGVTSQAEKAFRDSKSVLQKAYDAWPDKTDPGVQAAVASIKVDPNDTREKLTGRIAAALASVPGKDAHVKSFNDTVDKTATDTLREQAGDYAAVKADFDNTGFELFPQKEWRWGRRWCDGWTKKHVAGILFSIGLLSLGAPFWYSLLKNLVNLRSQVAQNISTEQKEAKKQPDKDKPKPLPLSAPPTVKPPDDTQAKQAAMLTDARKKFEILKAAQADPTKLPTAITDLDSTLNPKTSS